MSASTVGANAPDMLAHGRFSQLGVYRPAHEVKQFVLLLSGAGGGKANLTDAALALVDEGAMVALINTPELLASLERDAASCTSPDGDLENLSRYVQAYYRLPTYITPILMGYAEGGTFAYAMISQAPPDLFAGALSLQFCRALPLKRPLCPSGTLQSAPDGAGIELAPATRVQVPWITLQIEGSGACAAALTPEFTAQVPHAEEIVIAAHGASWTTT